MSYQQLAVAAERYLHILYQTPKRFHILKAHEKDFLFSWLWIARDYNGRGLYNLYQIKEAKDFLFNKIIQTYEESNYSFKGQFSNSMAIISEKQVQIDKLFFDEYLHSWKMQLEDHKGPYLSLLKIELDESLKDLRNVYKDQIEYLFWERHMYAIYFHIYYMARLYFSERNEKGLIFDLMNYKFVANIRTFFHTFANHYFPSVNELLDTSLNRDIPCIDINNFLESMQNLVISYFNYSPYLDTNKRHLLYTINGEKYILWIDYKRCNELSHKEGFEIRSFYKCERDGDIRKFIGTKEVKFDSDCYCCIEEKRI